jgi:hypothetical protein
MDDLKGLLAPLMQSGKIPPAFLRKIEDAQRDPARLSAILTELTALLGPAAEAPLNIEDYYREEDGRKFELRWPLAPANPLAARGIPFDALDRKTQFFTLFAEWSGREAEGLMAMNDGDVAGAQAVFLECVERADQIDVAELRARSYENLARVAERRSDQKAVLSWLDKAKAARAAA